MKILVTGAGGFIGRNLVDLLVRQKHEVLAVDNNLRGSLQTLPAGPQIQCIEADVLDATRMIEICDGIDAVYHLAYINGTRFFYTIPDKILEIGIIGTHNVLKACLKKGVKRFYLASSSEVYQHADKIPTPEEVACKVPDVLNPRYSYGGGKIACELMTVNYLRNAECQYVIFRPHNVYGPNMGHEHVLPDIIRKVYEQKMNAGAGKSRIEIQILGSGEETRSFIYVTDAARAIEHCTLKNSATGIYHVGTENEISIKKLVQLIGSTLDLDISTLPSEAAKGATPRRCPNTARIAELGFAPQVSLEEGIRKTAEWYWKYYSQNKPHN